MKKTFKSLLLTLLSIVMVFNTCGFVFATTSTPTITISEATHSGDVKKLVFNMKTPSDYEGVNATGVVFSFDNTVIQPWRIDQDRAVTFSTNSADTSKGTTNCFKAYSGSDYDFSISPVGIIVDGTRTAIRFDTAIQGKGSEDFSAGADFATFYFKVLNSDNLNDATFKLEKDYTAGETFLGKFYADIENAAAIKVVLADSVKTSLRYGNAEGNDAITLDSFTFTGYDKWTTKSVNLNAPSKVDYVSPEKGEDAISVPFTATVLSTSGEDKTSEVADKIEYAFTSDTNAPEGVTISGDTVKIAPCAKAGTVKVEASYNGVKSGTVALNITRAASVATYVDFKANGANVSDPYNVTKPAEIAFTADNVRDQYDSPMSSDGLTISMESTSLTGVTFENNTLTVTEDAATGDNVAVIRVKLGDDTLAKTMINISSVIVDTSTIAVKDITYGQTWADAFVLPQTGNATAGDVNLTGTFSIVNGSEKPVVGNSQPVIVNFTVTTGEGFVGQVFPTTLLVNVVKATYNFTPVVDAVQAVYGTPYTFDFSKLNLPEGVTYTAKYVGTVNEGNAAYDSADAPEKAGTYQLVITFDGDEDNYEAIADKVVDFTVERADAVIAANETPTLTYNGAVQAATAEVTTGVGELQYAVAGEKTIKDAGTYTITVTLPESANYNEATKTITLTIAPATVTGYVYNAEEYTIAADAKASTAITTIDELKTALNLPDTVVANYGNGEGEEQTVNVTWTCDKNAIEPKGATYTFKGKIGTNNTNLNTTGAADLTATYTVAPVNGTIVGLSNVTIAASPINDAIELVDIVRIPTGELTVDYAEDVADDTLVAVWTAENGSDALAALQAAAALANEGDQKVTLKLDTSALPYATIAKNTIEVTITAKYPVNVIPTMTTVEYTYGEDIIAPTGAQDAIDDGIDDAANWVITYKGLGETEYAESTDAPKNAGTYEAIVTLDSATHSGSASVQFTIAPLAINYTVADYTKIYKDAIVLDELSGSTGDTLGWDDTEEDLDIEFVYAEATKDYAAGLYADAIDATASNANYVVTVVKGALIVEKKALNSEDIDAPVVNAEDAALGTVLEATLADINADEYTWKWMRDGEAIDGATASSYTVAIADSGKTITAVAVATEINYTGEATSDAVAVDIYNIEGSLDADIAQNGDAELLDADDVVSVDTTTILYYDELVAADADLTIYWLLDGAVVSTDATYTIDAADTGKTLSLKVAPANEDFGGELVKEIGKIGKKVIGGYAEAIYEAPATEGIVISIDVTNVTGDYVINWYRDGEAILDEEGNAVTGAEYTVAYEDLGTVITVELVGTGDYSGKIELEPIEVPALVPSDVLFEVEAGSEEITVTVMSAKDNGAEITEFDIYVYDAEGVLVNDTIWVLDLTDEEAPYIVGESFVIDEGLENGEDYTVKVTAINEIGESEEGDGIVVTPKSNRRPIGSSPAGGADEVVPTYTVTFNTVGGSEIANAKVLKGETLAAPGTPAKEGFVFGGWYTSKSYTVAYDFDALVNKNFTLYAKWVEEGEATTPVEPSVDPSEKTFGDVAVDAWYAGAVNYAIENGLFSGVSDTEFAPDSTMTRAMLVTVLYRAAGEPEADDASFTDVAADSYYAKAVAWAKANGIINGVTDTDFAPNAEVLREQIASIIHRYAEYKGFKGAEATELSFADNNDIAEYAKANIQYMVANGFMNGKDGNAFAPKAAATRAEVATILQRFLTANVATEEAPAEETTEEVVEEVATEETTEEVVEEVATEETTEEAIVEEDVEEEVVEETTEDDAE